MYPRTSKSGYVTWLAEFVNDKSVYIVCPQCNRKAIVNAINTNSIKEHAKMACVHCGYNKVLEKVNYTYRVFGNDPYFQLPLWLMVDCCGYVLWAYNEFHLDFIRSIIEASLRERDTKKMYNSSLASRLPKWMLSSKNREHVLKAIRKLESKI
jgi:Zn ribbon nucleic-acid-binding protein